MRSWRIGQEDGTSPLSADITLLAFTRGTYEKKESTNVCDKEDKDNPDHVERNRSIRSSQGGAVRSLVTFSFRKLIILTANREYLVYRYM